MQSAEVMCAAGTWGSTHGWKNWRDLLVSKEE